MEHSPAALYAAILDGVKAAKHRVSLASLYLGNGPLERAFVAELSSAVRILVFAMLLWGVRAVWLSVGAVGPQARASSHCMLRLRAWQSSGSRW